MICAPSEDSDQPGFTPSLISLRCLQTLDPLLSLERTAKTDQIGQMPRLIRLFAGRTSFCWFCHEAAQLSNFLSQCESVLSNSEGQ